MTKDRPIIPIIMCGGTGSRLWPLSRESYPKQYLSFDQSNRTLLQKTQERLKRINNIEPPILICNEEHRFIVAEQMNQIDIKPQSIILEPVGRNTAPAISIAAKLASEKKEDPILLVLSSDHAIKNIDKFIKTIICGISYVEKNRLVTFGIIPNAPETGYGYIESLNELDANDMKGEEIISFIEKPNLQKAKKLCEDKRYTWNSGIFMFKASVIIKEMTRFYPDLIEFAEDSLMNNNFDLDFRRLNKKAFQKFPNISIDIAVMEKTNLGTVLPLDVGWSDLGSWNSLWQGESKDSLGNVIKGKVLSEDNRNCYLSSDKRLIVGLGLENLVIVETSDAILVANRNFDQRVKNIVEKLKSSEYSEGKLHQKVHRPWGSYTSIENGDKWQVKLIKVKQGASLSLQKHQYRSEHWVIVSGTAKIEVDGKEFELCENQSTYIPIGSVHRLSNPGKIELSLIEIQSGSYLGEDDIERFEDNYGRI